MEWSAWYTFGQMLAAIRLGQKAYTPDGRCVIRTPEGLLWAEGRERGGNVQISGYLFTDVWRIAEDEETEIWLPQRESLEDRERAMLINQYEELRADYLENRRSRYRESAEGHQDSRSRSEGE